MAIIEWGLGNQKGNQRMPTTSAQINPATYVLAVDGRPVVTYTELLGLNSEVDPTPPAAGTTNTKAYGSALPPTITLRRGLDANSMVWGWHQAVLAGDPAARRTCTLQLMGGTQVLLTYLLENAWLATVQIQGPQPPPQGPQVSTQTDTYVCDQIVMQPPSA
jgi:T4-like virus tail tube protein gp19